MRILKSPAGEAEGRGEGFTLVELLVVVSIIVALAAASVVAVGRFAGKGEEGARASETQTVQAAMDAMMAEKGVTTVVPNDSLPPLSSVNNFAALPVAGPLASYMRKNPTVYFYCWNITGKVMQVSGTVASACPAVP